MKLKHLLQLAVLAFPAMAYAVPAAEGVSTMKNPDGSTVQVRMFGDEHFHFFTDVDAQTILERDARGYWVRAEREGRVMRNTEADLDLLWKETLAYQRLTDMQSLEHITGRQRMAPLDSEGRTTYNTIGEIPALVVLVEFKDTKFSIPNPKETIERFCNQEGYSDYKSNGSARDYFMHVSGGKFKPHFNVVGPITASENAQYYSTEVSDHINVGYLINDALTQLDDEVNFADYDLDKDGIIDNIYFLYAGHGAADTKRTDLIWPHQGHYANYSYYLKDKFTPMDVDGVKMATYAIGNELKGDDRIPMGASIPWLDGIGTFCHEYGHVLGLPDLYETKKQTGVSTPTPKSFDIMDMGSYNNYSTQPPVYSAYEKWVCNWLEYVDLEDGKSYEVLPHSDGESQIAYRSRVPRAGTTKYTDEYFIIESRKNSKWDSSLPEYGMLIWKIDYSRSSWQSNDINNGGYARVHLLPSNESSISTNTNYAWPGAQNITESYPGYHALTPHAYSPNFSFILTDMSYDANSGTGKFTHNIVTSLPTHATKACIPTRYESGYNLHLSWLPLDEATNYSVTLKRIDDSGTERFVDGLNDKKVGNVTELLVRNISASAFKQRFELTVRTHEHLPSSNVSEPVSFTTDNLLVYDPEDPYNVKAETGVDFIETVSENIFGGNGCIIAPESAQVFSISGQACGKQNLEPGIYLVRYGAKTSKVLVK